MGFGQRTEGSLPMNRAWAQCLILAGALAVAAGTGGCRTRNVVFATNSSIGLDVSGVTTQAVPDHVSVAYDRKEVVYVPKGSVKDPSVLGTLDAELGWFNGVAVSETFATGSAARVAADPLVPTDTAPAKCDAPLLVLTKTALGLSLDWVQSDDVTPSLQFGYKRSNLAVVPPLAGDQDIASVYADISIHSSGLLGKVEPKDNRNLTGRQLSGGSGVRIVQSVATGQAATRFVSQHRDAVTPKLIASKDIESSLDRYALVGRIVEEISKAPEANRAAFVKELNGISGSTISLAGTTLTDDQASAVRERLQPFSVQTLTRLRAVLAGTAK
jgi:hypothetical protein